MSVRLRDVGQPGMRHRKNPGCFNIVTATAALVAVVLLRRKR